MGDARECRQHANDDGHREVHPRPVIAKARGAVPRTLDALPPPGRRAQAHDDERVASAAARKGCSGAPDRIRTSYTMPIEGRDEWLAAAGLSA